MRRGRAAAPAGSVGLGLGIAAPPPPPPPPPRAKPVRPAPTRPAPVAPSAPVATRPLTPWERVAAECPDGRSVDAHELPAERWTCSCGFAGDSTALGAHRCVGVALLEGRAFVHVGFAEGEPICCVPGALARSLRWTTAEPGRTGLERHQHATPLARPRYEPIDGRGRVTAAYSAAEEHGRRVCVGAPVATTQACGCSPAGLCTVARALVARIDERRMMDAASGGRLPRAAWRHAYGMSQVVLRAHLRGVALTYAGGRWRARAIRG